MKDLHYHVSSGKDILNIYSVANYTDSGKSIQDFLDMSFEIFDANPDARLSAEKVLRDYVDKKKPLYVTTATEGVFMLAWSVCSCDFTTTAN